MMPIAIATKGKGTLRILERARIISSRYGFTTAKMERILDRFSSLLHQFDAAATFTVPASVLARSKGVIEKYQEQGIEFAVHGYYHVDHTQLSLNKQIYYLEKACDVFEKRGLVCAGFRSPYLRWNASTIAALNQIGFTYEGSQALAWDVVDGLENEPYHRALNFYGAISANNYPALPRLENGLVRIPYCLPDDEALIDRFHLEGSETMNRLWLAILEKTYAQGELFTLGLHPERILLCEVPLLETLRRARALSPMIWIARLDEITQWWKEHAEAAVTIASGEKDDIFVSVQKPAAVTILTRGVNTTPPGIVWDSRYHQVPVNEFSLRCDLRPFIGVSHSSSPKLTSFLRQQGYLVEIAERAHSQTFFLDRSEFHYEDERPLLAEIEQGDFPLVRLGRWPNGARSALCVTGDIDALTVWDYWLRLLGQ